MRVKRENRRSILCTVIFMVRSLLPFDRPVLSHALSRAEGSVEGLRTLPFDGLRTLLWAGLALAVLWLTGCGRPAAVSGTVVLYTSVPTVIIEELKQEFEAQNPGMYLQIYRKGTSAVVEKINEEIAAGQVQADVIWVANFTVGEELKEKGVLLPYTPPEAAEIPDILKEEDGYYCAGRLLIMVVAYNTDTVSAIPTGYKDLLDKRYRGRIGHDTPETSGSLQYFMGTLLPDPDFGEEFLTALAENAPQIQTSTKTTQRIADGELDMGITIDNTVRKLLKENPGAPIDYVYPEAGVVMVPSPIAIFKDSQNIEVAKVFVRYILSKRGQAVLRDLGGYVPVRLDVSPPERITSITQLKVIPSDKHWITEHKDEIVSKFIGIFGPRED